MKPKILAVCSKGLNRSKYLASYLVKKGYSVRFGGLEEFEDKTMKTNPLTQLDIDWADIIIIIRKRLKKILTKKFNIKNKRFVILDVTDSPELIPKKFAHLKKLDFLEFQKKWTYPQLRKAIKPYFPFK